MKSRRHYWRAASLVLAFALPAIGFAQPPVTWTNPETGITITLPPDWAVDDDARLPAFLYREDDVLATLICDDLDAGATLETYAGIVAKMVSAPATTGPFVPTADAAVLKSTGQDGGRLPTATLITAAGTKFCRINYAMIDALAPADDIEDPALTAALFESLKELP